ncbi:MAG: transcriptional regulator [Bacteroides sp.]|nr:transcriptional regulator [Bacteroides sp.]
MNRTPNESIEANEALLCQLDSLIRQADCFIANKEARIDKVKQKLQHSHQAAETFQLNSQLYWEYRVYDADSALKYVNHNLQLARQHKKKEWEITSLLDLSFIYTANGLLDEALKALTPLNPARMTREQRSRHYGQMRTLCSRQQLYSQGDKKLNEYWGRQYALYSDSVLQTATPDEPRYLYARVWKYQEEPEQRRELIRQMEEKKKTLTADSRNYSIFSYQLATLYKKEGNITKWVENMILSGMADVRGVNRDMGSLHALASHLYANGYLDRAYQYSTYCSEIGYTYKSRVRLLHLSELQNKIHQSYIERDKRQKARLHLFLTLISTLSLVLIVALFFLRQQVKKRKEANRLLKNVNKQLRHLNKELKSVNAELRDTNYIKEEYIGQVFKLCSNYISLMEEYRKNLNRKLKVGQIEELKKVISSTSTVNNEMKEFYESFDSIFLHLFPHFVTDFNNLLRPEERIEVKPGKLNTELRIHALIRLGITDSEKIAECLHCSQQTVYNNRSMTGNKSTLSKEDFIRAVKELGKVKE